MPHGLPETYQRYSADASAKHEHGKEGAEESSATMNTSAPRAISTEGFSRSRSRAPTCIQPIQAAIPTGIRRYANGEFISHGGRLVAAASRKKNGTLRLLVSVQTRVGITFKAEADRSA